MKKYLICKITYFFKTFDQKPTQDYVPVMRVFIREEPSDVLDAYRIRRAAKYWRGRTTPYFINRSCHEESRYVATSLSCTRSARSAINVAHRSKAAAKRKMRLLERNLFDNNLNSQFKIEEQFCHNANPCEFRRL